MSEKIATLYGRPLQEFTKDELIDAINKLDEHYKGILAMKESQIEFLWDINHASRGLSRKKKKRNRK